jgi:2'-5' RNA ligase
VQHAHGHRTVGLADGEHLGCGVIALMPTEADAKRLKLAGGESAADLHVTLFFLGCDMAAFAQDDRVSLTNRVMDAMTEAGPTTVTGNVFGVSHWNGNGEDPCWVLTVGDAPAETRGETGSKLETVRELIGSALDLSQFPEPHSPFAPHIRMAYTSDLSLAKELQKRLGPVEFDRVRVAFGSDYTDIPLSGALTAAAAPLRRNLTSTELAAHTDFERMQSTWESAVDAVLKDLEPVFKAQQADIVGQVSVAAKADDLAALDSVAVDEQAAYEVLAPALLKAAQQAAEAQQKEAEAQGVTVPDWSLTSDTVTAAAGRDLLDQVARVTARLMATSLVQSAVRTALRLFGHGNAPGAVTAGVQQHLDDLTDAQPRESVGGAVTQAQAEGRRTVLAVAPTGRYFASEVLDRNSCKPCRDIDGTEYASLAASFAAYPSGGYRRCLGGSRCRGTIVTVWNQPAGATASAAVAEGTGMPWTVTEDPGKCGPDEPYTVVNSDSEEDMGCFPTREAAQAHADEMNAGGDMPSESMDYAAQVAAGRWVMDPSSQPLDYATAAEDGSTAPWTGPLAVEGIVTGDGREFAPDALTWADLPVPLRWNKEDSHGGEPHTVAVNVGRIDKIWRDGSKIMGSGVLNLAVPDGQTAYDLIKGKFLRGVSIDADSITDADVELVWPESDGAVMEDDPLAALFGGPPPEKMIFHAGRIRAATLVDIPAFAEAYVALTDDNGAVVAGGEPYTFAAVAVHHTATSDASWDAGANEKRLPSPLTLAQARAAYAWTDDSAVDAGEIPKTGCKFIHHEVNADGSAGPANLAACSATIAVLHGGRGGTTIPTADERGVYNHVAAHLKDAGKVPAPFAADDAVTAGAMVEMADFRPHPSRFADPKLAGYTGVVITDDGYLYGHIAPWNACHIGYDGQCVTAPREDTHDHYMTGEVVCSDGSRAAVGQITIGTGHASLYVGARPAAEHYDNTGTAVADVAVGNDKHGIWLAGQIRPGADPSAVFALRAAGRVSGDWRNIGGKLRLVALLGVNTAGFLESDLRTRARVAGGQPMALVAAGATAPVWHPEGMDIARAYKLIMDQTLARFTEGR